MHDNRDTPGAIERFLDRLPDGALLKWMFRGLLVLTIGVLGFDLRSLIDQAPGDWETADRTSPLTMRPAQPSDHLRPYLPRTNPVRRSGDRVTLPGFEDGVPAGAMDARMVFVRGDDGAASALGRIEGGTAGDFERFMLDAGKGLTSLTVHSPGGSVSDALEMGRLARAKGITLAVARNGYCASSCPLFSAGGRARRAGRDAWIGVHQVYTVPSAIGSIHDGLEEAQRVSAVSQQHLVDMGVDPRVWIHAMRTPKEKLYIFTPEQLEAYKLATEVEGRKMPKPEKVARKKKRQS
ncbi:MAG: hypothetical protein AAFQ42_07965 [Pseudomonadota bacterium]